MSVLEREASAASIASNSSSPSYSQPPQQPPIEAGKPNRLPKRIILVRHCESEGNVDCERYCEEADWRIPLSALGREQALELGHKLKSIVGDDPLYFYCSPYLRTKQTLALAMRSLGDNPIVGAREEPRLTEQQFGNFQNAEEMQKFKENRGAFGRFYYRFPDGESGLDVYNRITSFIGTLFRLWSRATHDTHEDVNVILVTHGLTLRLFLMRWFRLTVQEFETSWNPDNGCVIVMDRCTDSDLAARAKSADEADVSTPDKPPLLRKPSYARKGTQFATSQILELEEEEFLKDTDADAKAGPRVAPIPNSWSRFTISEEDMHKIGFEASSPMFSTVEGGPAARLQKIIDEANI
jgi:broad specificity phosphatase PhoE